MMRSPRRALAAILGAVAATTFLVAAPAQAASPYHASVGTTGLDREHRTTMGSTVTISGKVWGGPVKNQKVTIYMINLEAPGRTFSRKLAVVPINSENRYTYRWRSDDAGAFQLRVVKGAYRGHKAVKVTSRIFEVFRWVGRSPGANVTDETVAGVRQPASGYVVRPGQDPDMFVGFGGCNGLRGKGGISDTSSGDARLVFYDAENAPWQEFHVYDTTFVKGAPMRAFQYDGFTAYYSPRLAADFGASPQAGDGIVLTDVQEYCGRPVKNQWNPNGYGGFWWDEATYAFCVGEQVAYAGDTKCKIDP